MSGSSYTSISVSIHVIYTEWQSLANDNLQCVYICCCTFRYRGIYYEYCVSKVHFKAVYKMSIITPSSVAGDPRNWDHLPPLSRTPPFENPAYRPEGLCRVFLSSYRKLIFSRTLQII